MIDHRFHEGDPYLKIVWVFGEEPAQPFLRSVWRDGKLDFRCAEQHLDAAGIKSGSLVGMGEGGFFFAGCNRGLAKHQFSTHVIRQAAGDCS